MRGAILSDFGPKPGGLHNDGINISATRGASVVAADNGVVAYAGNELRGFGNLLLIRHADGWMTAYAHLDDMLVERGAKVTRGQKIGTVGSTGNVSSPQLHFEVRRGNRAIDPRDHLGSEKRVSRDSSQTAAKSFWMNCHATRPDRPPRVCDHSIASALSSPAIVDPKARNSRGSCEESLLVAGVEPQPQPEAIAERHLLLDRLGRVHPGRSLVLDHVPRHQVPPVRGGVEHDIVRPPLDSAVKNRLQRLVMAVVLVERQIVAEQQEPAVRPRSSASSRPIDGRSSRCSSISFSAPAPRRRPRHAPP